MRVENGNITLNAKEKRELGLEGLPEFLGKGNQLADYLMDPETGVGGKTDKYNIAVYSAPGQTPTDEPHTFRYLSNCVGTTTEKMFSYQRGEAKVILQPPNFGHSSYPNWTKRHKIYGIITNDNPAVLSLWNDQVASDSYCFKDEEGNVLGRHSIVYDPDTEDYTKKKEDDILIPPNTFLTDIPEHQYYQLGMVGNGRIYGITVLLKIPAESEV